VVSPGLPDAEHKASDRRFGTDKLSTMFGEFDGAANDFVDHIVEQVDRFMDGGVQFDDMSIVCLRRND
jgi:serine phosphatase RsbU (regulator of sigma subunit)